MGKENKTQLVKQLKSNLNEILFSFIWMIIAALILSIPLILIPSHFNATIGFGFFPFFFLLLVSAVGAYYNGRASWWFSFVLTFVALLAVDAFLVLATFLHLKNFYLWLGIIISLLISLALSWRWGATIYNPETMKHVLESKRVDVEKGTYSPFTFPFGILTTKRSKKWFAIANASGPLFISLTLILGHWLGKHTPKIGELWTAFCGYAGVVLCIGGIRAGLGEYAWIRRWENETGRKMYISYVVDWKRYKEEEKRRKQAEQAKLNASRN